MLTEFQRKWAEWKKKWENRVGDVYDECERRGCERDFLEELNARIEVYPLRYTLRLLEVYRETIQRQEDLAEVNSFIHQWKIYLEVLVERRSTHEMWSEWDQSLQILNEELPML